MKKLSLSFALVFATLASLAQPTVVDTNNVAVSVDASGSLFRGSATSAGFEFPKGSGVHTIYASSLWLAGMDIQGQVHVAAGMFGVDQEDFYPGPLTVDGSANTSSAVMQAYDRVWLANAADVDRHLLFLESVNNGTYEQLFPDGYETPQWFFEWPAMGDFAANQDFFIAPFLDYDGDLTYNPSNGDYPLFPGDECAYFILNDRGGFHELSQAEALGVEIHCFVYSFDDPTNEALSNTVFVRYEIINRSSQLFTDLYAGIWSDLDIGFSGDDYIASHVQSAAYYGYNGDSFDEPSIIGAGYGMDIPIQTVAILNGPLMPANETDDILPASLEGYTTYGPYGAGFGDGVMDNERLGLTSFLSYQFGANPVSGDPTSALDFFNYLTGLWQNGMPVVHGGNGITGNGIDPLMPSMYMLSGDSDPAFIGTGEIEVESWTEVSAGNAPGDRRGMGAMGPFQLLPGEHQTIDIAYSAISNGSTTGTAEELVEDRVTALRGLFFDAIDEEIPALGISLGTLEISNSPAVVRMYPNPADQQVSFIHPSDTQIQIFSSDGRLVAQWFAAGKSSSFDVQQLESGIYLVKASGKTSSHSEMLVVR